MENNNIEQKESIKLMKMSKGYQWEIKLLGEGKRGSINDGLFIDDNLVIKRLEKLDKELREKFDDGIKLNEVKKKK